MSRRIELLCWYTPTEWVKVRAVSADADAMGLTYEEWLKSAQALKQQFESEGATVMKVDVQSEALLAFARSAGLDIIDKSVRERFILTPGSEQGRCT